MIGILNIGVGNIQSVFNAIYENGYDPVLVNTPAEINELSHLILPGVGNFSAVINNLKDRGFLTEIQSFIESKKPVLGICLGMQLLAKTGEEGGISNGLNVIPARVKKITSEQSLRVPHVGWNEMKINRPHPVFLEIKDQRDFYFVHSYQMVCQDNEDILGVTQYGSEIVCAVAKDNVIGVQFHPEKSQKNGMLLLENFCEWDGKC